MFNFGNRRVNKQGGSFMISLPIEWIRNTGKINAVNIKMDDESKLIVTPATKSAKIGAAGEANTKRSRHDRKHPTPT